MSRLGTAKMNKTWAANLDALGDRVEASDVRDIRQTDTASMAEVARLQAARHAFQGRKGQRAEINEHIQRYAVDGDKAATARAVERSAALVDDAIALEPRLARKPQWERSDDGIFADAGLVASGDDSPCYQLTRRSLREASAGLEPVLVTISTDSSEGTSLAALVAVVRIVQQFRPVHVYWQGAWLADDGSERGYVFHAPIITGDMDYSRLQYIVEDWSRDSASFGVLHQIAVVRDRVRITGLGRHAERSYLPAGGHYVSRAGIRPDADRIAATACAWLGIDSPYWRKVQIGDAAEAAQQSIPKEYQCTSSPMSPGDWARYDREAKQAKQAERARARARVQANH